LVPDPDPGGPKKCGSGSATLHKLKSRKYFLSKLLSQNPDKNVTDHNTATVYSNIVIK
jgi:hypothetical protein